MKKILIVTPVNPEGRDTGTKLRIYHLSRLLRQHGFELYLLVVVRHCKTLQDMPAISQLFAGVRHIHADSHDVLYKKLLRLLLGQPVPLYPEIRVAISKCVELWRPDYIQFEKTFTAAQADLNSLKRSGIKLLLEEGGVHHLVHVRRIKTSSNIFAAIIEWVRARRLKAYEARLVGKMDAVTSVSRQEANLLRSMNSSATIVFAPNGVDEKLVNGDPSPHKKKTAMFFCGDTGYAPNKDALYWFINDVFPLIAAKHPGLRLVVSGGPVPEVLTRLPLSNRVDWLGRVPDVHVLYSSIRIFINPMRQGAGTRLKILEAMAHGMACVSTSIGAEGIILESGRHVILADHPSSFASAVCALVDDPLQCSVLGKAARALIASCYTWPQCACEILKWYNA